MSAFDIDLGRRLRQARRARGMSQQEAGDRLGVSYQQVQKYEAGTDRLPVAYLAVLKDLYGTPLAALVPGGGDVPAPVTLHRIKATARLVRDFEAIPSDRVRARVTALVHGLSRKSNANDPRNTDE